MEDGSDNIQSVRTWRDIPQAVKPRAMTSRGKRRYALRLVNLTLGVAFVLGATWAAIELTEGFANNPSKIARATQSAPLRTLKLNTDGVLTQEWVKNSLRIPANAALMEVDLTPLQSRLLSSGQVRVAILSKTFPDTLNVSLTERSPVARIKVEPTDSPTGEMYVARDGVVFSGACLDKELVDSLPWIDDPIAKNRTKDGRIAPVSGMETVSDLLTKARYEGGRIYSMLRNLSLARLESDGEIEVRSPECEGIIFSTREDFFRQLSYLDFLRDTIQPTAEAPLARIDLSHGSTVPVTYPRKPNAPVETVDASSYKSGVALSSFGLGSFGATADKAAAPATQAAAGPKPVATTPAKTTVAPSRPAGAPAPAKVVSSQPRATTPTQAVRPAQRSASSVPQHAAKPARTGTPKPQASASKSATKPAAKPAAKPAPNPATVAASDASATRRLQRPTRPSSSSSQNPRTFPPREL